MKTPQFELNRSKKNLKFRNEDGYFASEKEAERYRILKEMELKGSISDLQCHVTFILLPAVYKNRNERKVLKTKIKTERKSVCIEQGVTLDVSFVYRNKKGKLRAEVVKNDQDYKDPTYILKRKLIRYLNQIIIIEN